MSNTAQTLASGRIAALLDENSFVEIGAAVTARATDFNMNNTDTPSDGVITGYVQSGCFRAGRLHGRDARKENYKNL